MAILSLILTLCLSLAQGHKSKLSLVKLKQAEITNVISFPTPTHLSLFFIERIYEKITGYWKMRK